MKQTATRLSFILRAKKVLREEFYAIFPGSRRVAIDTIDGHREPKAREREIVEKWLAANGIDAKGCWDIVRASDTSERAIARNMDRKYLVNKIKEILGMSWSDMHKETGVPLSSLFTWATTDGAKLKQKYVLPINAFVEGHMEKARVAANEAKWKNIELITIAERSNEMRLSPEFLTDKNLEYYGLEKDPFTATVESADDIWLSKSLEYAMQVVEQGARRRKGLLCFYGRSGSGKTVLAKLALEKIKADTKTKVVFLSDVNLDKLSPAEFLREIHREMLPEEPVSFSAQTIQNKIVKELASMQKKQQRLAIFIDEAQSLSYPLLKGLKRFLEVLDKEIEYGFYSTPVLFLLFGHTEIRYKMEGVRMEEVKGRVYLTPMDIKKSEIQGYLEHKTRDAFKDKSQSIWSIMEKEALSVLKNELAAPITKGAEATTTPLDINIMMSRALKCGFTHKEPVITEKVMTEAFKLF